MDRRAFLKFFGVGAIGAGSIGCLATLSVNQMKSQKPNILFIFSDDHFSID